MDEPIDKVAGDLFDGVIPNKEIWLLKDGTRVKEHAE